jgi:hypothetical protein
MPEHTEVGVMCDISVMSSWPASCDKHPHFSTQLRENNMTNMTNMTRLSAKVGNVWLRSNSLGNNTHCFPMASVKSVMPLRWIAVRRPMAPNSGHLISDKREVGSSTLTRPRNKNLLPAYGYVLKRGFASWQNWVY